MTSFFSPRRSNSPQPSKAKVETESFEVDLVAALAATQVREISFGEFLVVMRQHRPAPGKTA